MKRSRMVGDVRPISSADGDLKLRVQYSSATLIKIATDIWILIGDIDA